MHRNFPGAKGTLKFLQLPNLVEAEVVAQPFIGAGDIKTLAAEAGVDRTAFYGSRPYAHLRVEFERRLQALQQRGDPSGSP